MTRSWALLALVVVALFAFTSASDCSDAYHRVFNGTYPYAKALIDATGRGPEDLGNHRECRLAGSTAKYCILIGDKLINGTIPPIGPGAVPVALGVCAPTVCNVSDLADIYSEFFGNYTELLGIAVTGECLDVYKPLPVGSIVVLGFVGLCVLLVVLGSMLDCMQKEDSAEKAVVAAAHSQVPAAVTAEAVLVLPSSLHSVQASESVHETAPLLDKSDVEAVVNPVAPHQRRPNRVLRAVTTILLQFSLPRNFRSWVAQGPGELNALNGLRVFAMLWIIFGHTGEFFTEFIVNRTYVTMFITKEWLYQVFPGAYWNVDTFFFLSGFLIAHATMAQLEKNKGRLPIHLFYIHRLLRLWPTYLFVLLLYIHLSVYVGEGFLWDQYTGYINTRCEKWWTNMLFVNNFWPTQFSEQCLGWSWYLANDMQFYIISPFILLLYYKNKKAGIAVLVVLLAASMGVTTWLLLATGTATDTPMNTFPAAYMDNIYSKPYCRVAPFLIGIAFSWAYTARPADYKLSAMKRWFLYAFAFITMYTPIFLVNLRPVWTAVEGILYSTAARISWPLGVSALMFTCFVSPDAWLSRLFAANVWGPLARLTFSAYLSHPIILFTYYLNRDHLLVYTDSDLVFWWIGAICVSYMTALALGMVIEKPALNLEKLLFGGGGGKRKGGSEAAE